MPRKLTPGQTITIATDIHGRWDLSGKVQVHFTVGETYTVHQVLAGNPIIEVPINQGHVLVQLLADEIL